MSYRGRGRYSSGGGGGGHYDRDRSCSPGRRQGGSYDRTRDYHDAQSSQTERGGRGRSGAASSSSALPPLPAQVAIPTNATEISAALFQQRGTLGKPIQALVNHHQVTSLPLATIYQYSLSFTIPDSSQIRGQDKVTIQMLARLTAMADFAHLLQEDFVFDGVSLGWSPKLLLPVGESREASVNMGGRRDGTPNEVRINIRSEGALDVRSFWRYLKVGDFDVNPMGTQYENVLKWLNALFSKEPALRFKHRNNSYYHRTSGTTMSIRSTADVLEAVRGFHQVPLLRFGQLTVNIDTATTVFWVPDMPLTEVIRCLMHCREADLVDRFLQNPSAFFNTCAMLLGSFFKVRYLPSEQKNSKVIRFKSWSNADAINTTFDHEGRTTNIKDYFVVKYGITIKYPELPLANSRQGDLPLELCFTAPGERYRDILKGDATADLIKFATAPAFIRQQQIGESLKLLASHDQDILKKHGLSMRPQQMTVHGRILPAPEVIYGGGSRIRPYNGTWNLKGMRFARPASVKSWALLDFTSRKQEAEGFATDFARAATSYGLNCPRSAPIVVTGNPQGDMRSIIDDAIAKGRGAFGETPDLLLCLLRTSDIPLYQAIKLNLDLRLGIASQVMSAAKAITGRSNAQYLGNIMLKVNVKLGGCNAEISEPVLHRDRWMLIGGDISHASPAALKSPSAPPSVAALVGTWDRNCVSYTSSVALQESTEAIIQHCEEGFKALLRRYRDKNNGQWPRRILYVRDGVSESEFNAVVGKEGAILRKLCALPAINGSMTLVVAIKRHHTRFFGDRRDPDTTKLGNVAAGFVVENNPKENDIFLVAHADLQGTKRPTRYVTLIDENKLSANEFQGLMNNLCSSYARATRSISVAPPVYYADQAAERARILLQNNVLHPVHDNLKFNMYWQ